MEPEGFAAVFTPLDPALSRVKESVQVKAICDF
jgi:hypothetical protein